MIEKRDPAQNTAKPLKSESLASLSFEVMIATTPMHSMRLTNIPIPTTSPKVDITESTCDAGLHIPGPKNVSWLILLAKSEIITFYCKKFQFLGPI